LSCQIGEILSRVGKRIVVGVEDESETVAKALLVLIIPADARLTEMPERSGVSIRADSRAKQSHD
jgi:hypothetical protein